MISAAIRKNIIDVTAHFFASCIFGLIIYVAFGNLKEGLIFFLGGVFIDLDHLIDYFLFCKKKFSIKNFFNNSLLESEKICLFFHSWELIVFVFLIGLSVKAKGLTMLSLGLASHLIIDNVQRENRFCYFLIYRMAKKFNTKIIFPGGLVKRNE